ncbi:hypothetical protein [Flavimarina sp. Hel_I_48]|uniref:hypothetical protein n=1 Tax=Flavimarina sp. Hel_I_48 TaxID=1392488 RepID=UPI001F136E46|nr:hypothetical protein [Flavimarina sp. Hel_I_48]
MAEFPNDSGPIYRETVAGRFPVEPFNTLSNLVFLFIVIYFSLKVYKSPSKHPFLIWVIPIIGIAYVGGTVYHATRSAEIWLLMDWVPIMFLSLAGVVYFIIKWTETWSQRILLAAIILGAFFGLRMLPLHVSVKISFGYLVTALAIAIPIIGYLYKTHWYNAKDVIIAFAIFGLAVFFRTIDKHMDIALLWMGTHWLWHSFGGLAVFFLIRYIYKDNTREATGIS